MSLTPSLQNSFSIRTPASVPVNITKLRPELPMLLKHQDLGGTTGTVVNPQMLGSNAIFVSPSSTATFFLPPASQILRMFGYNLDSGQPKLNVGDVLNVRVINRGSAPAVMQGDVLSSDGSAVSCPTGGSLAVSGATVPVGAPKDLFIEFLQVNYSTSGMTGYYTVY